jgi:biotin carboxyl carrier protein
MKLDLTINGADKRIDLLTHAPGVRFRFGDGEESAAHVETPEPGVYSILIGGRSYDARVEEAPNCLIVVIDGHRFEVEVRDPRRRARRSAGRHGEGVQDIVAPMPGKVIRVLIAPGDVVSPGQGLVVVEAMKMQNELKAQREARVAIVHAREGATVAAGEILVTLE